MLKIFQIKGMGHYCESLMIVAANTLDEAIMLGNKDCGGKNDMEYYEDESTEVKDLAFSGSGNIPCILLRYEFAE